MFTQSSNNQHTSVARSEPQSVWSFQNLPKREYRAPGDPGTGILYAARCPSQTGPLSHAGYGHRRLQHLTPGLEIQKYVPEHSRNPLPVIWARVS